MIYFGIPALDVLAEPLITAAPSASSAIRKPSASVPASQASPFTEDDFNNHSVIPLSQPSGEVDAMLYFRQGVFQLDPLCAHETQGKFQLKKKNVPLLEWLQNPPLVICHSAHSIA